MNLGVDDTGYRVDSNHCRTKPVALQNKTEAKAPSLISLGLPEPVGFSFKA
jgi:hypothetical protein